jgi:sugar phosphate permease
MITFAVVVMSTVAGFLAVAAITEWSNSAWLYDQSFSVAGSHLVFWGFVDFGLALLAAYSAAQISAGKRAGQVIGFMFGGVNGVRWLFYIPADPWLALVMLTIDGLLIFALAEHDDWFWLPN